MMAPPLNIKAVNTNKQQYYLKQKKESLSNSQNCPPHNKSCSIDLSQPGKPRSLQKSAPKSSSLLNVSKIKSDHPSDKYNTSESEMEGRNLQSDISRKTKLKGPSTSLTKRQMSADHLDSGLTTSRRGSFTSHDSFQSDRSISSYSDDTLNIRDIRVKGRDKSKAKDIINIGFGHLPDQVYKKAVRKGF